MDRFDLSFLHLRFLDIVDIILVAVIIYYVYNLIRGTIAVNIVSGLVIIYLVFIVTEQLKMQLLSHILGGFVSVGFLALIIVFQIRISLGAAITRSFQKSQNDGRKSTNAAWREQQKKPKKMPSLAQMGAWIGCAGKFIHGISHPGRLAALSCFQK